LGKNLLQYGRLQLAQPAVVVTLAVAAAVVVVVANLVFHSLKKQQLPLKEFNCFFERNRDQWLVL
jgi:hypothetical protein